MSQTEDSTARQVIHHGAALRVVQGAIARAEALGVQVCVAVMDCTGTLVAFTRMPKAFLISSDMAMKKAHSAAAIGASPEAAEAMLAQEAPRVREGILQSGFCLIRGGLPLFHGADLIGAVGVSGGSEAQDQECAQAGVEALKG